MLNQKRDQRGLSDVVTTVLLIGITIAVTGVIWAVVNTLVTDKIDNSKSCFGIFGKAEINSRYTCYNSTSKELQFSISVGDLDIDEMLIGIRNTNTSASFRMGKSLIAVTNVAPYPSGTGGVLLPAKNAGLTYLFNYSAAGFETPPTHIEIIPIIDGNQCETVDSLDQIDNCELLTG